MFTKEENPQIYTGEKNELVIKTGHWENYNSVQIGPCLERLFSFSGFCILICEVSWAWFHTDKCHNAEFPRLSG